MSRITRMVLRHKLLVVLTWLIVAVAGFATLSTTTKHLTADFALPGQPGYVADQKIAALYHSGGNAVPTVLTATAPAGTTVTSPAGTAAAGRVFDAATAAWPGSRVADIANTGDRHLATADGRTAFALVFTPGQGGMNQKDPTPVLQRAAAGSAPAGWTTAVTGLAQLETGGQTKSGSGSAATEAVFGGLGALLVLAFVFASFIAFVPLLMAIIAIPSTFLLVLGLTEVSSVSVIVEFLIALIGLGVAIDYSLLVVNRWREQRAKGWDNTAAVVHAMDHAGRAVVFSGLTVAISLLALVVLPVPFLANIGFAGFFIPIVSIAVAVTLLPVLLATVGPRLDWPHIRHEGVASRPWTAWARLVLRHRKLAAVVGAGILVALVVPLLSIRLGEPTTSALAQSGSAHTALTNLQAGGVGTGLIEPVEVLVHEGQASAAASRAGAVPGVLTATVPSSPSFHRAGTTIIEVLPTAETSSPAGGATVSALRHTLAHQPGVIGVGGAGPTQVDFVHAVYGTFPLMLALIAAATLILLTRAFRSVVLAVKAVVFNLLSVGAAFGTMVLVWQQGHGSHALWSIPATGSITVWVPLMVFAFLFGLSMDYEVFILTRMREEYDATGSTDGAVLAGIGRTGRLVTSAALILCMGFLSMSSGPMTDLKVMATGLGAGILLDAVVVRCLLVPALVGVLGRWNWWLPAPIARVLRVEPSPLAPAGSSIAPVPGLVPADVMARAGVEVGAGVE